MAQGFTLQELQQLGATPVRTMSKGFTLQELQAITPTTASEPGYFRRVGQEFSRIGQDVISEAQRGARVFQSGTQEETFTGGLRATAGLLRSGLRTTGAVARGAFTPIFEAPGVRQVVEKVGEQALKIPGAVDIVTSIGGLVEKYPQQSRDIQDIIDIATLGGGKIAEKPLASEIRAVGSDITGATKAFLTPSEAEVQKNVIELFNRSIKPSKKSIQKGARYENSVLNALRTIRGNADNLNIEDATGEIVNRTPETIQELRQAVEQTKEIVFNQYDSLAKQAGKTGAVINPAPIAKELETVISNRALQLTNPEVVAYAQNWATRLSGFGELDTETAQEIIKLMNRNLDAFYRNPTYDTASKVAVDAGIANHFRKSLDSAIEGATGEQYQALKSQYSALKAIESDVIGAAARDAKRNVRGLLDYTDIFTGGQMIGGILSLNPSMFTQGAIERGFKEYLKFLNDPNRAIANIFDTLGETTKTFNPQSALGKFIANPKVGLSIEDVSKKGGLSTKFLNYVDDKLAKNPNATLSRQEILDFANRPELKKGEADLLNKLGSEIKDTKIPAQDFADSIRRDLLELKPVKVKDPQYVHTTIDRASGRSTGIADHNKGYEEVVFESPITTNGSSHYPNSKNYFAHARGDEVVESGKKIWREQEIQSDLLQKDNLARQVKPTETRYASTLRGGVDEIKIGPNELKYNQEFNESLKKLEPFTNDRFGERIMRERIKEKAQKGYSKYRLPTGETIGRIEGFVEGNYWTIGDASRGTSEPLTQAKLKIGQEIVGTTPDNWIITDILGDGRFKAVPKDTFSEATSAVAARNNGVAPLKDTLDELAEQFGGRVEETFDLTGKSNPQYRRYEQWGKFLKNKYGGKTVTDPQGNSWVEIDLTKAMGRLPIEAFGAIPFLSSTDASQ